MSKYKATVSYVIDSDDLDEDAITEHFDNQGDEKVSIQVENEGLDGGIGSMVIEVADANVEVIEY